MMEFTIEDLVKILRNGVKMCAATDTTLVHITVEAAREAAYYLEDFAMLISDSGKGGESG